MPKVLTNRRMQVVSGTALVLILIVAGGSMGFASAVHSSTKKANNFLATSSSSKLLTSDGKLIANLHKEIDRDPVALRDIPKDLQHAAIAIEDRRFFSHNGIDLRGIGRAFMVNILKGERQGGSTISQQLAKNLYYHGEPRTWWRKLSEAVLTLGLESRTDKKSILEGYLNTAYFGRGVYGAQAAAGSYFHKDVRRLSLAESAFLAGLIHAPSRYDYSTTDAPQEQQRRKAAAISRRDRVLKAMVDMHFASPDRARLAKAASLDLHPPRDPRWQHPYFVDAALRELGVLRNRGATDPPAGFGFLGDSHTERAQSVYRKGLRIYTTLDTTTQRNAERALKEQLPDDVLPKASAAAVTVEPGTGFVRALIGGRNYYPKGCEDEAAAEIKPSCRHAKVNLALGNLAGGSGRQPGSSFKPFVLAAALENGLSLKQTLNGSPFSYKYDTNVWKVANYEGSAGGSMSVVDATVKSVNAAYARLEIQFLGEGNGLKGSAKVAAVARKLGINFPTEDQLRTDCKENYGKNGGCTPADAVPAIALGAKEVSPLEMAGAYATFANEGVYARPTMIEKITDAHGKVLYEAEPQLRRAVSRKTALGVSHVLQQVVQRGTGRAAQLGERPVAGKTGTSQMWRDAWFAGYVPQLTSVVWLGNPVPAQSSDGSWAIESMTPPNGYGIRVTGGSYPARIWNALMAPTVAHLEVESFPDAPQSLFGPPKQLPGSEGMDLLGESGIDVSMRLRRAGRSVVVHRACPPGGGSGRGMTVWKQEERGGTTHIWRSRAVCR
jgi:penicillin-binding protein 1A